jgi:hypothetical protein
LKLGCGRGHGHGGTIPPLQGLVVSETLIFA